MLCILVTLLVNKPSARAFSMAVLVVGLGGRLFTLAGRCGLAPAISSAARLLAVACIAGQVAVAAFVPAADTVSWLFSITAAGLLVWTSQRVSTGAPTPALHTPLEDLDGDYSPVTTYVLAASRPSSLILGVIQDARHSQADVVVVYVREVAIPVTGLGKAEDVADDQVARTVFAEALAPARRLGVPVRLVYLIGGTVADQILQTAIEADASKISMQIRKRRGILSFFKGDVIGPVAERLPETMELVVRA